MKHETSPVRLAALMLTFAVLTATAGANSSAADPSPEQVLAAKSLTKFSAYYLVDGDIKLREGLKNMRQAKKQVDDNALKRRQLERNLAGAKDAIANFEAQLRGANARLAQTSNANPVIYNQVVAQVNYLQSQVRDSIRMQETDEQELNQLGDPRDKYIEATIALSDSMEAVQKQYDELARDAEVKAAIDQINLKARPKMKLGPSAQFVQELPGVRRDRLKIQTASIPFRIEGGVPHVNVTLNGKIVEPMVVDSGAAIVCLTTEVANKLGITPSPQDPSIKLVSADGNVTEAKVVVLKSMRLGQFVVDNVQCAINPPSVKGADNLLGASFLRHFVYRMDLGSNALHMSQISDKIVPAVTAVARVPTPRSAGGATNTPAPVSATPPPSPMQKPPTEKIPPAATAAPSGPVALTWSAFDISASETWVPTKFAVEAGKCYQLTAEGTWTSVSGPTVGPAGLCPDELLSVLGPQPALTTLQRQQFYLGQHPRAALIARIGAETWTFYVGAGCRFIAPVAGEIAFRINDGDFTAPTRAGKLRVSIAPTDPQWLDSKGSARILARIDNIDRLHITPKGPYWEYGGQWGKVGLHDGYFPTIINGILWWPKWPDAKRTEVLPAAELWPQNPDAFRIAAVEAKRGNVQTLRGSPTEIVLEFTESGLGSSQVGCVIATGNPVK